MEKVKSVLKLKMCFPAWLYLILCSFAGFGIGQLAALLLK